MPTTKNCWDAAAKLAVVRGNLVTPPAPLEPGVRHFVLAIERLGGTTTFSCEGHPSGFYIMFNGPSLLARAIASLGYLTVEIVGSGYRLSLDSNELAVLKEGKQWREKDRKFCLRHVAKRWEEELDSGYTTGWADVPDNQGQ